eukprot:4943795-Amphidinium_carterae.1
MSAEADMPSERAPTQPRLLVVSAGLNNIGFVHGPQTRNTRQLSEFVKMHSRKRLYDSRALDAVASEVLST